MRRRMSGWLVLFVLAALLVVPSPPAPAAAGTPDQVALFDPGTGRWHLQYSDGRVSSFYFGVPGDTPLLGDWDCDGLDTVALYRESTGFVYLRNSNDFGVGQNSFFFGVPGDVPIAGDWDGDGCDTFGVFRAGRFFLGNTLGTVAADLDFYFGGAGDQPFSGDFNGDGTDTVAVHRDQANWVFITQDLSGLPASGGIAANGGTFWRGGTGHTLLAGDWDGDGDDTLGWRSPAFHLVNDNAAQVADDKSVFGELDWLPVAGVLGPPPPLPGLALQPYASGLDRPLFATAPAGDDRLFVVEQGGKIKIVEDGVVAPSPFLDVSGKLDPFRANEQGLLGLAFHPGYSSNRLLYIHYTNATGATRVVEYRDGPGGPVEVRTVLAVNQPSSNHNGGMIQFGPDGRLHVGLGDGGGGGDPFGNGQNAYTPLGAIVGLDVDGTGPDHVWAIGLRNPWRFDWDGSLIYIGDVGQDAWEEIDVVDRYASNRNFGWNVQEGFACYPSSSNCDTSNYVQPVVAYPHGAGGGCSVTGGFVYRGWEVDGLHGTYLYSDLCSRFLRGFAYDGSEITISGEWEIGANGSVASFGEDGHGELYLLTFDGVVSKIVAAG
ncbi:MAG: PQQ-dependent sugar dehydrogenase [Acidimicrobiia bacterium]